VDVLTGKVMRSEKRADESGAKDKWSAASEKVHGRTKSGAEKLESALENERGKSARFDDIFKKATEKHTPREPEE
jgi:hypothetical protein